MKRAPLGKAFEASETARLLAEIAPDNLASLRGFFSREPQAITAALLQAIAADGPGVSEEDLRNPHFIAAVSTLIKRWEGPNESWQKVITPIRFERWLTRFRAALFGL